MRTEEPSDVYDQETLMRIEENLCREMEKLAAESQFEMLEQTEPPPEVICDIQQCAKCREMGDICDDCLAAIMDLKRL